MYPTLALKGDYLLSLRMSTLRTFFSRTPPHVARGDLIDFVSPSDPTYSVCKRVIGIEGDVVCLDPSKSFAPLTRHLHISPIILTENEEIVATKVRLREPLETEDDDLPHTSAIEGDVGPFIRVPRGYVWVVGDNLSNSTDSRRYGPVPLGLIRGKIVARVSYTTPIPSFASHLIQFTPFDSFGRPAKHNGSRQRRIQTLYNCTYPCQDEGPQQRGAGYSYQAPDCRRIGERAFVDVSIIVVAER